MRLLILFAAWAKDNSENSHRWINWYREILDSEFPNDDKFVAVNFDSPRNVEDRYHDLSNILSIERVNEAMHVNSDAASFQHCLNSCQKIINNYDYVLFLHTKGASYDFAAFDPWRPSVAATIFNRRLVADKACTGNPFLIGERGHMIQSANSIRKCQILADRIGCAAPVFHYAAGTTLFYAPAKAVADLIELLPIGYMTENLLSQGESRFFFEAPVPSLLTMLGAEPYFVGGARPNPLFSGEVSYNCDPLHNSYLVLREFNRRREQGHLYRQVPIPFIIGEPQDLKGIRVEFEV